MINSLLTKQNANSSMNFPSFVDRLYTLLQQESYGHSIGNASIQSRKQMLKYPKGRETDKMATYKSNQDVQPAITARKSSEWTDFNSIQLDFKSCALNTKPQSRPRIVIIAINIFGTFLASRVRHACACISLGLLSLAEHAVKPRTNRPFAR